MEEQILVPNIPEEVREKVTDPLRFQVQSQTEEQILAPDIPQEVCEKVRDQLQFYFGDINMRRDKFMKEVMMKNDGWFPIETLLSFNRLKTFLKEFATDMALKIVVDCAKALPMLDVNEDGKSVRRDQSVEFLLVHPEKNTLVVKGFKNEGVTMDDLLEFFKKYAGMQAVIMRSYREKVLKVEDEEDADGKTKPPELVYCKKFKGSVFVIFDTSDNAQKCLEDLKDFKGDPKLVNNEVPWQVMWQTDHKLQKQANAKERQELKRKADCKVDEKATLKLGTIINMKNVPVDVSREALKESWRKALKDYNGDEDLAIAFIDYQMGQIAGRIRLSSQSAKAAVEFMRDKLVFNGQPAIELSELAVEEEEEYLKQVAQMKTFPRKSKQNKQHGGGKRQRGSGRRR